MVRYGTVRYGGFDTPGDARVKDTVVTQLQPAYSLPFQLSHFCLFGVLRTGVTAHRFCRVMQLNMPLIGFIPVRFIEFKERGVRLCVGGGFSF